MTIYGVPIAEVEWTTWWMLGSAASTLTGFIGWQVGSFFSGAKVIMEHDAAAPRFSWLREKVLPGYLANRSFKRHVASRQLRGRVGRFFFNLLLIGLAGHIGFWILAAKFMQG